MFWLIPKKIIKNKTKKIVKYASTLGNHNINSNNLVPPSHTKCFTLGVCQTFLGTSLKA